MSAYSGTYDPSQRGTNDFSSGRRWKPIELAAMILGFVVFWPIGLTILIWKIWQRNNPGSSLSSAFGDTWTASQTRWGQGWENRWQSNASRAFGCDWQNLRRGFGGGMSSTGNLAFDEWRAAELARLEEERRKLEAAEQEFAAHMENLRRAKDREEFEHFMQERRRGTGQGSSDTPEPR